MFFFVESILGVKSPVEKTNPISQFGSKLTVNLLGAGYGCRDHEHSFSGGRIGANPVGNSGFKQVPVEKMNAVPSKFRESFRRRR